MDKKQKIKDILIVGFALFAMFFGSGNLIFPSYLGRQIGPAYWTGLIGFMIMGIGLPLLTVMASAKADGEFSNISHQVGKTFSIILMTIMILTIGPLLAIPRTAATTYEIGIRPFFPEVNGLVIIIIYFAINFVMVLRPSGVVDVVGKLLTPILLVILLCLVVKGILNPIGPVTEKVIDNVLPTAIVEGYQTMDAMAAVCFSSIIIRNIKGKGYTDNKQIIATTLKASLVAVIGLGIIYGGLMYLGAHTGNISGDLEKTQLITTISVQVLGNLGNVFLAVAVAVACLTTSIGLTTTAATYFSDLSKGRISYNAVAIIVSVISIVVASMGVDRIIGITVPILNILYPVIVVLVVISLIEKQPMKRTYQWAVYTTLLVVVVEELAKLLGAASIKSIMGWLPLSSYGFAWIMPALAAYLLSKCLKETC